MVRQEGRASYSKLQVTLPTFVVLILRERAKLEQLTVSEVTEAAVLEDVFMDEVQDVASRLPDFGCLFKGWFASATRKAKK